MLAEGPQAQRLTGEFSHRIDNAGPHIQYCGGIAQQVVAQHLFDVVTHDYGSGSRNGGLCDSVIDKNAR